MSRRVQYPFTAIVGQEDMKNALILNTVNPRIGGVLIRGEKGTAKSTAVRALAGLLPERMVVKGCQCGCSLGDGDSMCPDCLESTASGTAVSEEVPMVVVELPLSSTEDRVTGTLDIEHAISTGKKKFEPGILAKANGNILYVDEVNLLDDHI
ncbi:MAG: magnesium chelatase ATPase subunit I, partial [Candidatus Methanomethylophilaceae archaeon]|nr:magnesium chelatase ATPase subunit I [Candidatus Methanomethylophilaceae archaeon]